MIKSIVCGRCNKMIGGETMVINGIALHPYCYSANIADQKSKEAARNPPKFKINIEPDGSIVVLVYDKNTDHWNQVCLLNSDVPTHQVKLISDGALHEGVISLISAGLRAAQIVRVEAGPF